jgi:hypothetical protein
MRSPPVMAAGNTQGSQVEVSWFTGQELDLRARARESAGPVLFESLSARLADLEGTNAVFLTHQAQTAMVPASR